MMHTLSQNVDDVDVDTGSVLVAYKLYVYINILCIIILPYHNKLMT